MNKDFILKGIALPLALAAAVGIIFFLLLGAGGAKLFPVTNGINLAYYDELNPDDKITDDLQPNAFLGTVSSNGELPLRYEADYSNLLNCASLCRGSGGLGDTGCIYIKIGADNVSKISTSAPLIISDEKGEYIYEYTGEKLVNSESEAKSLAPKYENSAVIFYRVTKGIGLTNEYYALIYKGAK